MGGRFAKERYLKSVEKEVDFLTNKLMEFKQEIMTGTKRDEMLCAAIVETDKTSITRLVSDKDRFDQITLTLLRGKHGIPERSVYFDSYLDKRDVIKVIRRSCASHILLRIKVVYVSSINFREDPPRVFTPGYITWKAEFTHDTPPGYKFIYPSAKTMDRTLASYREENALAMKRRQFEDLKKELGGYGEEGTPGETGYPSAPGGP